MRKIVLILSLCLIYVSNLSAQEQSAAQANNPLANMTALNFHNYYIPKLTDAPSDAYMNTSWIRFAKPLSEGKFLLRVSVPMSTVAMPTSTSSSYVNAKNGLGDINAFMAYSFISEPTRTVGVGPQVSIPTATDDALGAGKWQAGLAFVMFVSKSPVFQYGGLVTWQVSFAGDSDRDNTNMAAVQPFYFWQLGKGTYLRGAPVWAFNIDDNAFHMPIALGIGKVVKVGDTMFNLFIEPQYSMLHEGTQPQFQVFTGINLQFMGQ